MYINYTERAEAGYVYPALWVEQGVFDEPEYRLTYDANGGTGAPPSRMVPTNTSIALSTTIPTLAEHTFLGWALDSDATVPDYQAGGQFNIGVGDKTLYAVWIRTAFTLTYYANGGTGAPDPLTNIPPNSVITLSLDEPVRTGYRFMGWSQNQAATVPEYQPGDSFNIGNSNKDLYAVWKQIEYYTLTYNANGGNGAPSPQTNIPDNTFINLSSTIPTRQEIVFLGWATTETATAAEYQPGDQFNIGDSDKTLYAVWRAATIYIIHRDINSSDVIEDEAFVVPDGHYGPYNPKTFPDYGPGQLAAYSDPPEGNVGAFETRTIVYEYDKLGRTVHGFVWPMVTIERIPGFLDMHAVVVELRPTFKTPAPPELSVKAQLLNKDGLGEFTFYNVPEGNYVLYIYRPGYLVRSMLVTISPSDPQVVLLEPPGIADDGIFNLWWGDCNGDHRVDNDDVLLIMELLNAGVSAEDPLYNPACDMNADGRCDNDDVLLVMENWDKFINDYPGAEDVNPYQ